MHHVYLAYPLKDAMLHRARVRLRIRSIALSLFLGGLPCACANQQQDASTETEPRQSKAKTEEATNLKQRSEAQRIEDERLAEEAWQVELARRAEELRIRREREPEELRIRREREAEELRTKQEREAKLERARKAREQLERLREWDRERIAKARDAEVARLRNPLLCTAEEIQAQCKVDDDKFRGKTWVTAPPVQTAGYVYLIRSMPDGKERLCVFERVEGAAPRRQLQFLGGREIEGSHDGTREIGDSEWIDWVFELEPADFLELPYGSLEFAIYGNGTKYDFAGAITGAYLQGFREAGRLARTKTKK